MEQDSQQQREQDGMGMSSANFERSPSEVGSSYFPYEGGVVEIDLHHQVHSLVVGDE